MIRLFLPILLLAGTCFSACDDEPTTDLRDYYFPLRELTDGLVYEYQDLRYDSLTPDFWYYRGIPTDSAYYFTKAYYQNDFAPRNLYREEMTNDGILLRDLFLFETDTTGQQTQTRAEILSPHVFPFQMTDPNELTIYQVRFQLPSQPYGSTTVLINRKYGGDTTYVFEEQSYPAIYFKILGSVDQRDSIIGDIEPKFSGKEIYAKGLGLVYYERNYGEGTGGFQHQLVDRYPMQELAEQARKVFE
jgi:hypothetical protein